MKFLNFFKTPLGIFIIIAVIVILLIFFNWSTIMGWFSTEPPVEDNPTADGKPCTINSSAQRYFNTNGVYKNGVCVPLPIARLTAIQVQNIVNSYSGKDTAGNPTINFNGTFDYPNLTRFPNSQLQTLLRNGWWISVLKGGTLNGYKAGLDGNYLIAIYDMKDTNNPLNDQKIPIVIPAPLQPYLNIT